MPDFKATSPYQPSGDQPEAIASLSQSIQNGNRYQTLLGVTGSGKTYTMAKVIEATRKPTLIMTHNKTLAAQLYSEFRSFFPNNHVEYFISYYATISPKPISHAKTCSSKKTAPSTKSSNASGSPRLLAY